MTNSFYEVLDVADDADQDTIDAAYRERVKEFHPDVSDHPNAADRFRLVSEAHDVLSDPVERRRYDRLGHESYRELEGITRSTGGTEAEDAGHRGTSRPPDESRGFGDRTRTGGPETGESDRRTRQRSRSDDTGTDQRRATGGGTTNRGATTSRTTHREGPAGPGSGRRAAAGRDADGRPGDPPGGWIASRLATVGWGPLGGIASAVATHPATSTLASRVDRVMTPITRIGETVVTPVRRWIAGYESNLWLGFLRTLGSGRILERENAVLVGGAAMYVYPFVLLSLFPALEGFGTASPGAPASTVLLGFLAVGSLLLSGFPNVGLLFFGSWGVLLPIVLWRSKTYQLWSPTGAGVLAACWLPFLHSLLVLELIRRERGGFY